MTTYHGDFHYNPHLDAFFKEKNLNVDKHNPIKTIYYRPRGKYEFLTNILKNKPLDLRVIRNEDELWSELETGKYDLLLISAEDVQILNAKNDENYNKNFKPYCVLLTDQDNQKLTNDNINNVLNISDEKISLSRKVDMIKKEIIEWRISRNQLSELRYKTQQVTVIDEIIKRSLGNYDIEKLLDYVTQVITEVLFVDYCEILEFNSKENRLAIKSAFGQKVFDANKSKFKLSDDSLAAETLSTLDIILIDDFNEDRTNKIPLYLKKYDILSGISITIPGDNEPFGMMRVFANKKQFFTREDAGFLQSVVNLIAVLIDRKQNEYNLKRSEEMVRSILETSLEGIIAINEEGRILSFNDAAESIFGYDSEKIIGKNVKQLFPSAHQKIIDRVFENRDEASSDQPDKKEVIGIRSNGVSFPIELDITKVVSENMSFYTFFIRDISERRELEQKILQISEQERLRIGQDLHDGLGQMLTAMGLISENLSQKLRSKNIAESGIVEELTGLIKEADQYARDLSRGLLPLHLESNGLVSSLRSLVEKTHKHSEVNCIFEEKNSPTVDNKNRALHLYRIAQEAINNAVKHGNASEIKVTLQNTDDNLLLSVIDNGKGFTNNPNDNTGLGVSIMHYRARMIGGLLRIERNQGLTCVICTIPNAG